MACLRMDADTIAKHVSGHYETQVKLYSLALVKALRIESEFDYERLIGGLFYVFLRALSRARREDAGRVFQKANLGRGRAVRGRS